MDTEWSRSKLWWSLCWSNMNMTTCKPLWQAEFPLVRPQCSSPQSHNPPQQPWLGPHHRARGPPLVSRTGSCWPRPAPRAGRTSAGPTPGWWAPPLTWSQSDVSQLLASERRAWLYLSPSPEISLGLAVLCLHRNYFSEIFLIFISSSASSHPVSDELIILVIFTPLWSAGGERTGSGNLEIWKPVCDILVN